MLQIVTNSNEPYLLQNIAYNLSAIEVEYTAYNTVYFNIHPITQKHYQGIILELFSGYSTLYPLYYLNRRINRVTIPDDLSVNGLRVTFNPLNKVSIRIEEKQPPILDGGVLI